MDGCFQKIRAVEQQQTSLDRNIGNCREISNCSKAITEPKKES